MPFSCKFWCCQWLPCPPMLPSLSPCLVPEVQFPGPMPTNSMPVTTKIPFTLVGTVPPTSRILCKSTGCHSTRIRKGCDRWMCKAHCIEAGGCSQPPHRGSEPQRLQASSSASDNILLPPLPPPSHQALSIPLAPNMASPSTLLINTMPTPAPLSQQIRVDPALLGQHAHFIPRPAPFATRHAGPAFSSHMSDIFTEQMVDAQRQWERNSQRDAVRIKSQEKAKQTVFVYPFLEVSSL